MGSLFARRLVIMAKAARPGSVKTRLAKGIGDVEALRFYRHALKYTAHRFAADRRWQTILSVAPDTALHDPVWPQGLPRIAQGSGDLGTRMNHIMQELPPGPVIIVGSDIPDLDADIIARAFTALGKADAVFGPARDGGYYLVGFNRVPHVPAPFNNVRWSSRDTLSDTVGNLGDREIAYVDMLSDIDDRADFDKWRAGGGEFLPSVRSCGA